LADIAAALDLAVAAGDLDSARKEPLLRIVWDLHVTFDRLTPASKLNSPTRDEGGDASDLARAFELTAVSHYSTILGWAKSGRST
jgi:hypothetical protein